MESSAPGPRVNCVIYAYIDTSTQAHGTATPDTAPQLSTIPVRSPKPTAPTSESPPALVAAAQRTTTRPPRRAVLSTHRCLLRQLWGRLCQLVCHAGDRFDTQRPAAAAYQLPGAINEVEDEDRYPRAGRAVRRHSAAGGGAVAITTAHQGEWETELASQPSTRLIFKHNV